MDWWVANPAFNSQAPSDELAASLNKIDERCWGGWNQPWRRRVIEFSQARPYMSRFSMPEDKVPL